MRHPTKLAGFCLASAVQAATIFEGCELTLGELALAYCNAQADDSDLRLRKWVEAFGTASAWAITSEQLETAAHVMREHGYAGASVNRGHQEQFIEFHRILPVRRPRFSGMKLSSATSTWDRGRSILRPA